MWLADSSEMLVPYIPEDSNVYSDFKGCSPENKSATMV
jgi:hypothetical protein